MSFPGTADTFRRQIRDVVVREPRAYVFPRTLRQAPIARLADVVVGLFADVGLYVLACPLVLGFSAVFLRDFWPIAAAAAGFFYLAAFWSVGQSPGMRHSGVRLVDAQTGGAPGMRRASIRAALMLPVIAAVFLLADGLLPTEQQSFASNPTVAHVAVGLVAIGVVSHLWALWDGRGRAIHDILAGVVALDERAEPPERADGRPTL